MSLFLSNHFISTCLVISTSVSGFLLFWERLLNTPACTLACRNSSRSRNVYLHVFYGSISPHMIFSASVQGVNAGRSLLVIFWKSFCYEKIEFHNETERCPCLTRYLRERWESIKDLNWMTPILCECWEEVFNSFWVHFSFKKLFMPAN